MGELKTISTEKSKVREEQLRRERAAKERRRRELNEKRKRMRQIRFFAAWFTIILSGLIMVLLIVGAIAGDSEEETKENISQVANGEGSAEVAFNPNDYIFTEDMYIYENSAEILMSFNNLKKEDSGLTQMVDFMMEHQGAYPENLLKLVSKNPETIQFALEYPFKKGQTNTIVVDLSKDYVKGKMPHLLQWDERWGYVSYGEETISLDGCGPTCLSMVAISLTGDSKWTPVRVARMSMQSNYYVKGQGTAWKLMFEGCEVMGLKAKEIGLSQEGMATEVNAGRPIIASMGPGDFTDSGHFIVIESYKDGLFYIKDPNSKRNTEKGWSYDEIKGQIKNMWSYKLNK